MNSIVLRLTAQSGPAELGITKRDLHAPHSFVKVATVVLFMFVGPHCYAQFFKGYNVMGDSNGDRLGASVSDAGDVNGDGFNDFIAGAPGDDDNGTISGSAQVYSGLDGTTLYTFFGDSVLDRFGANVSGAGHM